MIFNRLQNHGPYVPLTSDFLLAPANALSGVLSGTLSGTLSGALCGAQLRAPDSGVCLRLLLLAPVLEEWIMRAGVQEWLILYGRFPGVQAQALPVLLSACVFGLLHLGAGWPVALAVTLPGIALAALYQHMRDWRLCALLHGVFNACALGVCMP